MRQSPARIREAHFPELQCTQARPLVLAQKTVEPVENAETVVSSFTMPPCLGLVRQLSDADTPGPRAEEISAANPAGPPPTTITSTSRVIGSSPAGS